jgi:hypothetical protein
MPDSIVVSSACRIKNEGSSCSSTKEHAAMINAETLARRFHEAYERLAPTFDYVTREATAVPWDDVPEQNKRLMIAVCAEILDALHQPPRRERRAPQGKRRPNS